MSPHWQDLDVLDSVLAVLHPLHQMTDLLSGERYVTVSVVKPLLNHICTEILDVKDEDTSLSAVIKERMKELCYQAANTDKLLCLCSFVDLRFMLSVVPSEDESKHDYVLRSVKEEMIELAKNSEQESSRLQLPQFLMFLKELNLNHLLAKH